MFFGLWGREIAKNTEDIKRLLDGRPTVVAQQRQQEEASIDNRIDIWFQKFIHTKYKPLLLEPLIQKVKSLIDLNASACNCGRSKEQEFMSYFKIPSNLLMEIGMKNQSLDKKAIDIEERLFSMLELECQRIWERLERYIKYGYCKPVALQSVESSALKDNISIQDDLIVRIIVFTKEGEE